MAQLITAQFITNSGFATGLIPTVTINEALTGKLVGVFNMSETSEGNYIYNFVTNTETVVYFFKIDAGTDDVINRYQGNNNKIDTIQFRTGGSSITYNKVITNKEMEEIAKKVSEKLPKQKENTLDFSKIEEKLGIIEGEIKNNEIEIDYDTIISSVENNALKISKEIKSIKFPKIEKQDNKHIMDTIKNIEKKIDNIDTETKNIKERTSKIKTKKERIEEKINKMFEDIQQQLYLDDFIKNEFIPLIDKNE